jgi:hypothetical protein
MSRYNHLVQDDLHVPLVKRAGNTPTDESLIHAIEAAHKPV